MKRVRPVGSAWPALKPALDRLAAEYERATHVDDPVRLLPRDGDVRDREIAGFVAAALAFGRVRSVINSVEMVLAVLGPRPAQFVRDFEVARDSARLLPLVHRWTRGEDLVALILVLQAMLAEYGSIEGCVAAGLRRDAPDVTAALDAFSDRACRVDVSAAYRHRRTRVGVRYFFPRPSAGSACKRLNLFLRWMVRRDAVDPGGWVAVAPSQLIVPLDVHVIRLGRCLRLTRYKSPGWKMAAEITRALRTLDPADPIKYDFALCHAGMQGLCGFNRAQRDSQCPLQGACRPAARTRAASRPPSVPR